MTTQEERIQFVNRIKLQLDMSHYGFQVEEDSYNQGYAIQEAKQMRAIKELLIRLNVWALKGVKDRGSIDYPEAKRRIDYVLDPTSISKCKVNLLKAKKNN